MSLSLPSSSTAPAARVRSRSPGHADPTLDLEVALSEFSAALTDEERKNLVAQKSGVNDADAAFKFTLHLDELDPVRTGRVVATKLCSLLQTVQTFGQVIDTFVSSNPQIAALIWGSVKLTFMGCWKESLCILINFTSYFQKFTELLLGFDHLIPHCIAYETLFPDSGRLKASTCEFHLAIIQCCTQIVTLTRLPWQEKALAALTGSFEAQIKSHVDRVRNAATQAKDEVELAKAQYIKSSQVELLKHQNIILNQARKTGRSIRNLKRDGAQQAKLHKWKSLLNELSSYDYKTAYKNARSKRHKGTAQWVFDTTQFQDWYTNENSAVLNVAGKIGSGKTILTANIVDYIVKRKNPQQAIAFFFIRFDDIESQSPETITRSIVYQIWEQASVQDSPLELLRKASTSFFEYEELLELLLHQAPLFEDFFLILDGLDECEAESQRSIVRFLSSLVTECSKGRVKIVISARDSVADAVERSLSPVSRVVVGSHETDRDLTCFAREILREKQMGEWTVGEQTLIEEIVDAISLGGEGMFLWVYLTIEDICTLRSDGEIREALRDIPRKLSDTFDRVLRRIDRKGNTEIAQSVFKWTAAAASPLSLDQLSEALKIRVNQTHSSASQRVNGIHHLPAWCENLVHVEEGDETVHFSHHSIMSYLLGPMKKPLDAFDLNYETCNDYVGEICLTYIHFSDFQRVLTTHTRHETSDHGHEHGHAGVLLGIVDHTFETLAGKSRGRHLAKMVKMPFDKPRPQSHPHSLPSHDGWNSATMRNYPFLDYATQNWARHTVRISSSSKAWGLWQKTDATAQYAPWTDIKWQSPGITRVSYGSALVQKKIRWIKNDHLKILYFGLHKAMVYCDLLNHQPLMEKVTSSLIERRIAASHGLLDILDPGWHNKSRAILNAVDNTTMAPHRAD